MMIDDEVEVEVEVVAAIYRVHRAYSIQQQPPVMIDIISTSIN
jgi:hypothetical protein